MDQDLAPSRETSQEEDRFWVDTERHFFANPNPSLLLCLRSHAWHCRYIARQSRELLREHEEACAAHSSTSRDAKRAKSQKSGKSTALALNGTSKLESAESNGSASDDTGMYTVRFRIKKKGGPLSTPGASNFGPHLPIVTSSLNADLASYFDDRGFSMTRQSHTAEYDDDVYYNPVVNAKHDNKLKLPFILPSQAPDGIRLVLYCPETVRHDDSATSRRCGFKTSMLNDILTADQVPDILYGPSPVWSHTLQPIFKGGKDICPPYKKCTTLLREIHGRVADPVWESHNDVLSKPVSVVSSLLRSLGLTDVSPPCMIDYSPKMFTFVEAKPPPLCRRCLGISKVVCPLCLNVENTNNIPGVCFSNPTSVNHKYEFVFNGLDIYKARTVMGTHEFSQPLEDEKHELPPFKRPRDDDITAVLKEYLDTLEEIDSTFSTLVERVQAEKRPNFDYWSQVESQMIKCYIEQYNNKMMDNRYNYNTQRQSLDVLRIRLVCNKSSNLPAQWTDHALCSICGSDEDWDDDPILFCDCCYIPMHYCCLGYKPGTMSETMRQNVRRHKLLHTKEDDEPSIDEDEWMCPCCLFLLDQLAFLDENMAMKAIRISAGPRNKQMVDLMRDNPNADNSENVEVSRLPYVVGFEYDNPMERIDLCTLYRRTPVVPLAPPANTVTDKSSGDKSNGTPANAVSGAKPDQKVQPVKGDSVAHGKLSFTALVEYGNIPTTVAVTLPDEDIQSPFEVDLEGFEMDVLGRTITQFWSFKGMTTAQLEVAHDIFDENLVQHMTNANLDGMLKLFMFLPKEEETTHHLIHQDRILQRQKSLPQKRGRKPVDVKIERPPHVVAAINAEVVRGPETELIREDMFTLNCKNPLKKLVICVRMGRNFFVNLKIPVCVFCGFDAYYPGGGPMKRTSNPGTWAHVRCAIAVDCTITPKEIDYRTFVPKIKALKCLVCHNMSTAIVQCSHGNCCKAFHVSCAAASSCCLFTWDQNGKPDILCPQHASGLAPTVLLRKLQTKVQYKNFRKLSTHETNLDSVNPKDDIYLTHLFEPNYRSIANVIERIFDLKPRSGFPIPLYGDEVVRKPPVVEKDTSEKVVPESTDDNCKPADTKPTAAQKVEAKLPLRDKTGKFKMSEKSRDARKSSSTSSTAKTVPEKQIDVPEVRTTRSRSALAQGTATIQDSSKYVSTRKTANSNKDRLAKNAKVVEPVVEPTVQPILEPIVGKVVEPVVEPVFEASSVVSKSDSANDTDISTPKDISEAGGSQSSMELGSDAKRDSIVTDVVPSVYPKDPNVCRVTNLDKELCFWCNMGNDDEDEQVHYKGFYDDRCPTSEHVGSLLFPDFTAAKTKGSTFMDDSKESTLSYIEGVPAIVLSDICASSRAADEKMLSFISDDFIGGQRLISEVISKSCRSSLLGLTRLLNILYFKSKNGSEMCTIFVNLLRHMKTIQLVDDSRRNCEIGTNPVEEVFTPLTPMSPDYSGVPRGVNPPVDHRKECRMRVMDMLKGLNQTVLMRLGPELLPLSITRVVCSKSGTENVTNIDVSRHFVICSGCLEFKVLEPEVEEDSSAMRKRINYAQHYKTCRLCNARACSDCLSHMKNARTRIKVNQTTVTIPPTPTPTDAYMSAATLLSQPIYSGLNPPISRSLQPMADDDRIASVRNAMLSLPLMARSPLLDRTGGHPGHGLGISTPTNSDSRIGSMIAPAMSRGPLNTPSPVRCMMPPPPLGSPVPMCNNLPLSVPNMGTPLYNGNGGKTMNTMYDRNIPGSMCGGPFGKTGPMIKSPPVKNGPYLNNPSGGNVSKDPSPVNNSVQCDNTTNAVTGVPVPTESSGDDSDDRFLCCRCEDMENDINLPLLCCALCSRFDGLLVPVSRDNLPFYLNWISEYCGYAYVHLVCVDWLSYSKVIGASLRKFPKTFFEYPCNYCGVGCGATLTCSNNYCTVRFHASCGAWLGCKADMGKKPEGVTTSPRRVYCLRHTFLHIVRMSQVERKFMIAPPHLYEMLFATKYHLSGFFGGVYMSRYCVPSKMRNEGPLRPAFNRPLTAQASSAKRPKLPCKVGSFPMGNLNATMNMLSGINYMSLGLVLSKSNFGQPVNEYSLLPDNIARDRLIQALNWTAYNAMNVVGGRRDKKEIRAIIQLIKAGQLKPIHGSKRGRKPKSLDGSNFDNRQRMPMEDILTYCHSGQLDSGEYFCPVCFSIYFERSPGLPGDDLHWIGCDGCERWFHFVCAGVWADGQHVNAHTRDLNDRDGNLFKK
ncbi:uncharacterized protein BXIN_0674 [Babesia sp. Xinjiang]|uniref:uncharacterized protein n=1 Tax=Babesia sp. Xinjiang TaxID=462227 RepID=UPI000A24B438|nr:uncharacterized protein BXIN_0674 [Babesia sp. Xinjiang]ORM42134.1 hypothetical protein BXIN_0674 [Babesia sp. Xinjiang]